MATIGIVEAKTRHTERPPGVGWKSLHSYFWRSHLGCFQR